MRRAAKIFTVPLLLYSLIGSVSASSPPASIRTQDDVPNQIKRLKSESAADRRDAAYQLSYLADPRSIDPLIAVLGDADAEVRAASANALGQIGDKKALEPVLRLLKDQT
ncbi:MAG TPA: HEAT repeat domain-containing protein, partial [Blastocatellia bacterium]|nr:HEAT repeat domain-containing protein [Blastocatellia bacterium]